jgi:hypothetical protein
MLIGGTFVCCGPSALYVDLYHESSVGGNLQVHLGQVLPKAQSQVPAQNSQLRNVVEVLLQVLLVFQAVLLLQLLLSLVLHVAQKLQLQGQSRTPLRARCD